MKLYKAKMLAVNPNIPYTNRNKWIAEYGKLEYYDGQYTCLQFEKLFLDKGTLVVRKRFFRELEDIITGERFPKMKIEKSSPYSHKISENGVQKVDVRTSYHFSKVNQRLYVMLEEPMSKQDIKAYYERLSEKEVQERQDELAKMIDEEKEKYWHPIPKKVSNRQYVKMIEQMRKDI